MNVSIAAVVRDLDTTVSGVQSAIALEALVSAAFILIGSKVGDLVGRDRAYVRVCCATQLARWRWLFPRVCWRSSSGPSLEAWGLRCCCRPCSPGSWQLRRSSTEEGLRSGRRRCRDRRRVGPLLGGFITTLLSWRIAFLLEVVIIGVVLLGIKLVRDVPYTGPRQIDIVAATLSYSGWAASC